MQATDKIFEIVQNALKASKLGTLKTNDKSLILTIGTDRFSVRIKQKGKKASKVAAKVAPKPTPKPVAKVAAAKSKSPALKVVKGGGVASSKAKPKLEVVKAN